jgi:hypothetical protein
MEHRLNSLRGILRCFHLDNDLPLDWEQNKKNFIDKISLFKTGFSDLDQKRDQVIAIAGQITKDNWQEKIEKIYELLGFDYTPYTEDQLRDE